MGKIKYQKPQQPSNMPGDPVASAIKYLAEVLLYIHEDKK